jgi:hypothetical protein
MAETKAKTSVQPEREVWEITIDDNPKFCGTGAGGVQFANGKAKTDSKRMAKWFSEHPGYTVTAI